MISRLVHFCQFAVAVLAGPCERRQGGAGIAIVSAGSGFSATVANRLRRLMCRSCPCRIIAFRRWREISSADVLIWLGLFEPTRAQYMMIRRFCAQRGRLVVFDGSSSRLARMIGVRVRERRIASRAGEWSRAVFPAGPFLEREVSILQEPMELRRIEPIPGRGRVAGYWVDREGHSAGCAACICSDSGFWLSMSAAAFGCEDEVAAERVLAAICGVAHCRIPDVDAVPIPADMPVMEDGEVHAVWIKNIRGLVPGDWAGTVSKLSAAGVTDVFLRVMGGSMVSYVSTVLPVSREFEIEGDLVREAIREAHVAGIRVHGWFCCFPIHLPTATGWVESLQSAIDEFVERYRPDGVHLDYVRWQESARQPCAAVETVTSLVAGIRRRLPRATILSAAVFGAYPACVATVAQDWMSWLEQDLIDYAVPMNYTADMRTFALLVGCQAKHRGCASRIVAGIGVTADESVLDARQVIGQIRLARKARLAGTALFSLNTTVEQRIFPWLGGGVWHAAGRGGRLA